MKILSEKEEKYVKMEIEFAKGERETLLEYAMENMSSEAIDNFCIEWALIELMKKSIKGKESNINNMAKTQKKPPVGIAKKPKTPTKKPTK